MSNAVRLDLNKLEQQLGAFGYQWLAACAHFEMLHPEVTDRLGDELAATLRTNMSLDFDERAAFYSLPWMRQAHLPHAYRVVLKEQLDPAALPVLRRIQEVASTN